MKLYVASKSGNKGFALEPENIIAVCASGPDPKRDALSYAADHTRAEDTPAWVHEVEIHPVGSYKIVKEVVFRSALS